MFDINAVGDYRQTVEAVTADSIRQTLKQLVDAGNMFEVVMMPE